MHEGLRLPTSIQVKFDFDNKDLTELTREFQILKKEIAKDKDK